MENEIEQLMVIAIAVAPIITGLLQMIKKTELVQGKMIPVIGVLVGVLVTALYALAFKHSDEILVYILAGLMSGLSSNGFYQLTKKGEN